MSVGNYGIVGGVSQSSGGGPGSDSRQSSERRQWWRRRPRRVSEGTPPVAWANTERVLDPPKEPSYQEALLLTCDRNDSEEIRQIANLDPEIGQHHQERSHSPVLAQPQSTETRTPLVLEPRPMEEDHQADRVTCSAGGEVHVVGQVESAKPHIIGCGVIVDVRPCSSSSDSEHNEPRREAGVVRLLKTVKIPARHRKMSGQRSKEE